MRTSALPICLLHSSNYFLLLPVYCFNLHLTCVFLPTRLFCADWRHIRVYFCEVTNGCFVAFLSGLAGRITMHPRWVLHTFCPAFIWLKNQHRSATCKGFCCTIVKCLKKKTSFVSRLLVPVHDFWQIKLPPPNLQPSVWESSTPFTVVDGDASYLRKEHITPTQPLHSHH